MNDDANNFMRRVSRSVGKNYGVRPRIQNIPAQIPGIQADRTRTHLLSSGTPGFDFGSRAAGFTFLPSGTPRRYGKYFGIKPPGSSNY